MANFESKVGISGVNEFLTDLMVFATTNAGFTNHGVDSSGTEDIHRLSRTTDSVLTYWGFRLNTISHNSYSNTRVQGRMMLSLPTDINIGTLNLGQRFFTNMGLFEIDPPFTGYHFFTDGDMVFAVLEITSGVFAHMAFGNITKTGTWTGGEVLTANNLQFYTHTNPDQWADIIDSSHNSSTTVFGSRQCLNQNNNTGGSYIRFNTGAGDNKDFTKIGSRDSASDGALVGCSGTMPPDYNTARLTATASAFSVNIWHKLQTFAPSEVTFRAPLMPIYIFRQTAGLGQAEPLGYVPNITSVNIKLLNTKDIVNTDWQVFPMVYRGVDNSLATLSDYWGIAYRQVP